MFMGLTMMGSHLDSARIYSSQEIYDNLLPYATGLRTLHSVMNSEPDAGLGDRPAKIVSITFIIEKFLYAILCFV
jgi:hypothetical protein